MKLISHPTNNLARKLHVRLIVICQINHVPDVYDIINLLKNAKSSINAAKEGIILCFES